MKKMSIRFLMYFVLVSLITLVMVQIHGGFIASAQTKEVVVQTFGGTFGAAGRAAFYDPFTEATGIKVIDVSSTTDFLGKIAAQIKSGKIEWDVTTAHYNSSLAPLSSKGMLEEIDYRIVTDTKDLIPGSVHKYGVGNALTTYVMAYNTKKFPGENHPKSWADFFDVNKFPGPRAMPAWGSPEYNIVPALLADGVPLDKLTPFDYDRAFKMLDKIKPYVKIWYTSGDQLSQGLLEEQVVLANSTYGRVATVRDAGAPIALEWNQGIYYVGYYAVLKGAHNKKEAMQLINFTLRPELQAIHANLTGYSGTNLKSTRYIHPKFQKDQANYPDNFKKEIDIVKYISPWLDTHYDEMVQKFNTWLAK